jgi:hypothetical protein
LCLCGGLCAAVPLWAQEMPAPVDVAVPEVDVADSVRRMLEAARAQQGPGAVEDTVAPGQDEAPVPAPAPATPPPAPVPPAPAPAAAQRPAPVPSGHVPLPEREFTIRSVDDIRELARELEEAKQRQRRRE